MISRFQAVLVAALAIAAMGLAAADNPPLTGRPPILAPGGARRFDFMASDDPGHRLPAAPGTATTLTVLDLKAGDVRSVPVGKAQGVAVDSETGFLKGPYLQNPTVDAITICWESSAEALGAVRYGENSLDQGRQQDEKAVRIHRVRLTGLKPYTHYRYAVECLGETSEAAFLTAAPANQVFKFAVYGDTRTQPDMHAAVLKRMAQFQPDFILQTGDLVADGTKEALWTEFFQVTGETLRRTPYYPCLGNHERGGELYLHYFEVPREYSFDYGNIHFVSIDSNRPASEYAAQEEWLKNDLSAHQDSTWRMVFFHHTPYTCVAMPARRVLAEKLRARLEPILLAGHVQVVFNGHDHTYQHHLANGIHYVVTGGGGAPLYDVQLDTPYVLFAKKAYHYCEVTVDGARLTILARQPDGAVLEEFIVRASRYGTRRRM